MVIQIPSHPEQLAKSLQAFIEAAEQGEWDYIVESSGQLLLELELAGKPDYLPSTSSMSRKEIEKTLLLLNSAIEQCRARKEVITPLINAFAPAKATPREP